MPLEHYINKGKKRLRCGYTTGSCAALAAKAATTALLKQRRVESASILTPKGIPVTVDILELSFTEETARCAVRKDAGDDCDITDGMLVFAEVHLLEDPGIVIDGGDGVGRVTLPGLDQPVGAAAINRVPREMIAREVADICAGAGYRKGLAVTISVPGGEAAAARTFNPRLGIRGGISILGTTGIVEPQSIQALVDTIEVEMKMLAARGEKRLILTPGNYGEAFLAACKRTGDFPQVKCSNFIGDALDFTAALGFEELYLVGHIGKFSKLAAGIMNTHSRYADARVEAITAHAAVAGANRETAARLMAAATTDACIAILDEAGLRRPVMDALLERVVFHAGARVGPGIRLEAVLFSNEYGSLAATAGAKEYFGLEGN